MELKDMSLEQIAEELSIHEIQALSYLKGESYLQELRARLEKQAPSTEDIIAQYTRNQYVQQTVEVMPGLNVTLRTLPPQATDEALNFASANKGENHDNMSRILARRRLSYALIDVNDEPIGALPIDGSYFDLIKASPENFKKKIKEYANDVYGYLCYFGLTEKISEAFGVWENIIFNRINGIDDLSGTIKNSTRGSAKEQ